MPHERRDARLERLERGYVNLSLWRRDMCVETFHLTPVEASRLIAFLVEGLTRAVPEAEPVRQVAGATAPRARWRHRLAGELEAVAERLRGRLSALP